MLVPSRASTCSTCRRVVAGCKLLSPVRRFFLGSVLALAAVPAAAQTPATQTPPATAAGAQPPAAAQAAVPASRKFTSDAGVMFSVIKPDKGAGFEISARGRISTEVRRAYEKAV